MNKDQGQTVSGIMNQLDGVNLHEKRGGKFRFQMRMTRSMRESSIETLDLSVRAYHSLKRADYNTVGELVDAISNGMDLNSIRNCGKTSVREIMEHLFLFQYHSLPAEEQNAYLMEVVIMNLQGDR